MDIKSTILGNIADAEWKERLEGARTDWLELSQWDAQKNRFRRQTQGGRAMAVALERGRTLRDGDILEWDEDTRRAVVCRIRLCPVMAVDMHGLSAMPVEEALSAAVRLGHALGNQHWPAVVKRDMAYVPVSTGTDVAASVMDTHAIRGIEFRFLAGEEVLPLLDEQEARRLFGGAECPGHGHAHGHEVCGHVREGHEHRGHPALDTRGDHPSARPERQDAAHRDQHHQHGLFYDGPDSAHAADTGHERVFQHGFGREHRHGERRVESHERGHGGRIPAGAVLPERRFGGAGEGREAERRGPHGRRHRGRRHGHYDEM